MKIKKLKCSLSSLYNFLQTHAAQDYFLGRDIVLYHPYTMYNCFGHWRYDPVGQESYISSYYSIMEGTHLTDKLDFLIWAVYHLSAHLVASLITLFLYWFRVNKLRQQCRPSCEGQIPYSSHSFPPGCEHIMNAWIWEYPSFRVLHGFRSAW